MAVDKENVEIVKLLIDHPKIDINVLCISKFITFTEKKLILITNLLACDEKIILFIFILH